MDEEQAEVTNKVVWKVELCGNSLREGEKMRFQDRIQCNKHVSIMRRKT